MIAMKAVKQKHANWQVATNISSGIRLIILFPFLQENGLFLRTALNHLPRPISTKDCGANEP